MYNELQNAQKVLGDNPRQFDAYYQDKFAEICRQLETLAKLDAALKDKLVPVLDLRENPKADVVAPPSPSIAGAISELDRKFDTMAEGLNIHINSMEQLLRIIRL